MSKAIYEEIIDEIGTQTLARFGLNIFSLDTYEGYGASVTMTNTAIYVKEKYKNKGESQRIGDNFDMLRPCSLNIMNALHKNGEKSYSTDILHDIKVAQEINIRIEKGSGQNKFPKDYDFIMANYPDEVKNMDFNSKELKDIMAIGNYTGGKLKKHEFTDIVTFDKNGKVIKKEQLKTSQNHYGSEFLKSVVDADGKKPYKYVENNDTLVVPKGDKEKAKEQIRQEGERSQNQDKQEVAKKAEGMVEEDQIWSMDALKNPIPKAIITQSMIACGHITQAGFSDAIVVCLSTLANGAIYEIKDAFLKNSSNVSLETRLKRLLKKVFENSKATFLRGAGFGAIDILMSSLAQVFKSISKNLNRIWKDLRISAKSIYNGICDYLAGKIKSFSGLMILVTKSLFSATMVAFSITLEQIFNNFFTPIVSPVIVAFLYPALSIIISAIAVVLGTKAIENSLNCLFGIYANLQKSLEEMIEISALADRAKLAEISALVDEVLPQLISDNAKIERMIEEKFSNIKLQANSSFADLRNAINSSDHNLFIKSLVSINSIYGKKLQYADFNEFDNAMLSDEAIKF